ncbi:hypothetical protein [Tissierella sp. Yu-01]|uniref:hypothetical protein n=1 Tax=Tissierella sp. Yu-01 TaxID=3035694 RepID=UPI00240DD891|nr:hypothetical protein [Tissierella sp. Yu-01]WFA08099.1 hypothetical protein P3962_10200 [Tissierella sp. Yu-01]
MKEKSGNILNSIFSILILTAVLGGGIVFAMFILALIIGGNAGEILAVNAKDIVMPIFIRAAALAILSGLISSYIVGDHSLSIDD